MTPTTKNKNYTLHLIGFILLAAVLFNLPSCYKIDTPAAITQTKYRDLPEEIQASTGDDTASYTIGDTVFVQFKYPHTCDWEECNNTGQREFAEAYGYEEGTDGYILELIHFVKPDLTYEQGEEYLFGDKPRPAKWYRTIEEKNNAEQGETLSDFKLSLINRIK